jgi:hypothetical protein
MNMKVTVKVTVKVKVKVKVVCTGGELRAVCDRAVCVCVCV